mmetsp:Transcript_17005/g.64784  ORF Transcript_17005/g.64784 Transcript_17005/m.64784 type:complete len:218 (-) Transcript_17005:2816-3469(-)
MGAPGRRGARAAFGRSFVSSEAPTNPSDGRSGGGRAAVHLHARLSGCIWHLRQVGRRWRGHLERSNCARGKCAPAAPQSRQLGYPQDHLLLRGRFLAKMLPLSTLERPRVASAARPHLRCRGHCAQSGGSLLDCLDAAQDGDPRPPRHRFATILGGFADLPRQAGSSCGDLDRLLGEAHASRALRDPYGCQGRFPRRPRRREPAAVSAGAGRSGGAE